MTLSLWLWAHWRSTKEKLVGRIPGKWPAHPELHELKQENFTSKQTCRWTCWTTAECLRLHSEKHESHWKHKQKGKMSCLFSDFLVAHWLPFVDWQGILVNCFFMYFSPHAPQRTKKTKHICIAMLLGPVQMLPGVFCPEIQILLSKGPPCETLLHQAQSGFELWCVYCTEWITILCSVHVAQVQWKKVSTAYRPGR